MSVIRTEDLGKTYKGGTAALRGLNLTVHEAEVFGFLGPNGAGKSTMFKLITGQETPDGGTIKVGDTVKLAYVDQSRDALAAERRSNRALEARVAELRAEAEDAEDYSRTLRHMVSRSRRGLNRVETANNRLKDALARTAALRASGLAHQSTHTTWSSSFKVRCGLVCIEKVRKPMCSYGRISDVGPYSDPLPCS